MQDFKDELISFKPPPEGGCPPNQANGGEGPFYAWAQTPSEVHVTIEVDQGTTKQDVECDIRPERLSLLVKRMGGGRGLKVFHRATLWRRVKAEESMWTLDGLLLTITLSVRPPPLLLLVARRPSLGGTWVVSFGRTQVYVLMLLHCVIASCPSLHSTTSP